MAASISSPQVAFSKTGILFAVALLALAPWTAGWAGVRDERPNLVGGELLGRGLVLTANYERFFNNHFGAGAGLMAIGASGGTIAVVPVYLSYVPGDVHSVYLSGGGALLGGGGSLQDWSDTWLVQVSIGYQHQSTGGFFIRPLFTYMFPTSDETGPDDFLIWPGITIGGSF